MSIRSVTAIKAAPAMRQTATISMPIGPAPVTSTRRPTSSPARARAWRHTAVGSAKAASAKDSDAGTGIACSARRPADRGSRPARAGCAWRCRETACRCSGCGGRCRQGAHWPQGRLGLTAIAVTGGDVGDVVADCRHRPRSHDPVPVVDLDPHRAEAAMLVVMEVRAADAAGVDAHQHLSGAVVGNRHLADLQIMRAGGDDGAGGWHGQASYVGVRWPCYQLCRPL